jgi:glycosyltransferase involved in cell wall biosynthesis
MRILLVGNYLPDRQESMIRYAELLRIALADSGHEVQFVVPRTALNKAHQEPVGMWKWLGYADKYWLGVGDIARAARAADIVHICDHSNAVYVPRVPRVPHVVSCHDLLAVRGALGEDTDCPASPTGRQLQYAILRGLKRAQALACGSRATLRDAQRLVGENSGRLVLGTYALGFPYRKLPQEELAVRLSTLPQLLDRSYVLHVGSNLRRKNREVILRAVAGIAQDWPGRIVFAGQPLEAGLRALAGDLGINERIIEVVKPSNELLEGLYNGAVGLFFPSRFEGFGWPIIEAQACGCPVICSDRDPLPDVAGAAAIIRGADDAAAFGQAILDVERNQAVRRDLESRGYLNAARYTRAEMARLFCALYDEVAGRT